MVFQSILVLRHESVLVLSRLCASSLSENAHHSDETPLAVYGAGDVMLASLVIPQGHAVSVLPVVVHCSGGVTISIGSGRGVDIDGFG